MKQLLLLLLLVAVCASLMFAQQGGTAGSAYSGTLTGVTNYIPNYDVMGAHENGGRGCAGCHAPHGGAQGSGGNIIGVAGYSATALTAQGGLWGTDTGAILSNYATITFNGGNSHHSGVLTLNGANNWTDPNYTGVVTCISCHDGVVSKGAMMSGQAYEQVFGLLNGVGIGLNANRNGGLTTTLYGPNPIPTLLGQTGLQAGGTYGNDHPVGQTANLYAALGSVATTASYGLSTCWNGTSWNIAAAPAGTPFANFVASYYPGALVATVNPTGNASLNNLYVVCTTCHNQHNMAVYGGGQRNEYGPGGNTTMQFRTIFFVNGGYNPGAPYDPTHEPSTMRFCQQCHFSFSSEYFGATNVGTAY